MFALCRKSYLPHDVRKSQEVQGSPKKLYIPHDVRKSKPGKAKVAKVKEQEKPDEATTDTEGGRATTLSTRQVVTLTSPSEARSFLQVGTKEEISHHTWSR